MMAKMDSAPDDFSLDEATNDFNKAAIAAKIKVNKVVKLNHGLLIILPFNGRETEEILKIPQKFTFYHLL